MAPGRVYDAPPALQSAGAGEGRIRRGQKVKGRRERKCGKVFLIGFWGMDTYLIMYCIAITSHLS